MIEDLLPLYDVQVELKLPRPIERATLEPQGKEIAFASENSHIVVALKEFACHQMIVLHY